MICQLSSFQKEDKSHKEGVLLNYKPPVIIEPVVLVHRDFHCQLGKLFLCSGKHFSRLTTQLRNY